jgi:hypothetical protein
VERMDRLVRQTDQSRKISFDLVLSYESGRLVRCAVEPFRNVTISETVSRHCLPPESPWQSLRTMPDK